MKNDKEFLGILNASPEKRYKNFISTVADYEEVWLLVQHCNNN